MGGSGRQRDLSGYDDELRWLWSPVDQTCSAAAGRSLHPSSTDHTTWTYNPDDTVQSVTDARGSYATYSYNNRHMVTGIVHTPSAGVPASPTISYGYDAAGNLTSMTDGVGSMTYHYDQLSRMDWEERTFTGLSGTYRLTYGY